MNILFFSAIALTAATRLPAPLVRAPARGPLRAALRMEAQAEAEEDKEDRIGAGGRGGHAVPNQPELSEEERALQMRVMEHQRGAARLSMAEDAKSLVAYSNGYAVLSTISTDAKAKGYPSGALVGFAPDDDGLPVFCFGCCGWLGALCWRQEHVVHGFACHARTRAFATLGGAAFAGNGLVQPASGGWCSHGE